MLQLLSQATCNTVGTQVVFLGGLGWDWAHEASGGKDGGGLVEGRQHGAGYSQEHHGTMNNVKPLLQSSRLTNSRKPSCKFFY